jgi:hypothetical protein
MAATFIVASGSDPRKLISIPIKKILSKCRIKRKYEETKET